MPHSRSRVPGVMAIEPIRMASISDETFCEVILDDVEVPSENLLGTVQRWLAGGDVVVEPRTADDLDHELGGDPARTRSVRESNTNHDDDTAGEVFTELGSLLADAEALRATGYRALNNELSEAWPSPGSRLLKLLGSQILQRVSGSLRRGGRASFGRRYRPALRTSGRVGGDHLRRDIRDPTQHHRRETARIAEGMTMDYDLGADAVDLENACGR